MKWYVCTRQSGGGYSIAPHKTFEGAMESASQVGQSAHVCHADDVGKLFELERPAANKYLTQDDDRQEIVSATCNKVVYGDVSIDVDDDLNADVRYCGSDLPSPLHVQMPLCALHDLMVASFLLMKQDPNYSPVRISRLSDESKI